MQAVIIGGSLVGMPAALAPAGQGLSVAVIEKAAERCVEGAGVALTRRCFSKQTAVSRA